MSVFEDARKRWLLSRGNPYQPTFKEAFDGGFAEGLEAAWGAAEQLIEECDAAFADYYGPAPESILEAFAEARHDLSASVARLDRRFESQKGGES